ncbi:class I SAM-dependent methyltransferase [Geodermatophilus sp. SYSU D01176]
MAATLPALTPVEDSLFVTLCCRALDARSPRPVLGDAMADEIVRTLGYDCGQLHIDRNLMLNAALRAKKLDEIAARFLAGHPDGIGLDLGAGLDTRALRIDPPSTVDWYDVDFPAVTAIRASVTPDRANAHDVGADVTDPDWLTAVPSDRPAVIVADGLLGFLALDQVTTLLNRLTSHFPSGEIAFNSHPRFAIWAIKHTRGTRSVADLIRFPGSDDPHDPGRWNPALTLVREILIPREPEVAQSPAVLRVYYRLAAHSTSLSRKGTVVLHYRF